MEKGKKTGKRLLSWLLAVVMMVSLVPGNGLQVQAAGSLPGARSEYNSSTGDVFLGGNYIEVGVSKSGSFGTSTTPSDSSFHADQNVSGKLGLVSDGDGWNVGTESVTGDFFLPGTQEERWQFGYEIDGIKKTFIGADRVNATTATNYNSAPETVDASDTSKGILKAVTSAETTDGVKFEIVTSFGVDDKFFQTEVFVTNNSGKEITDVRFSRSFDPDQDASKKSDYATYNKVICQPDTGVKGSDNNMAMVVGRGGTTLSGLFFLAFDNRAVASVLNGLRPNDLFSATDLWPSVDGMPHYATEDNIKLTSDMINVSNNNGYGDKKDVGIGLGFKLGNISNGGKEQLNYYTSLDPNVSASLADIIKSAAKVAVTSTTITVENVDPNFMYSLWHDDEMVKGWVDGGDTGNLTDGKLIFEGLEPNTSYLVKTISKEKYKDNEEQDADAVESSDAQTALDPLHPEKDTEVEEMAEPEFDIKSHTITISNLNSAFVYNLLTEDDHEVSSSYIAPEEGKVVFTGLDAGTNYYLVAKTEENNKSDKVEKKTLYEVVFNANGHGTAPLAISDLNGSTKITSPEDPAADGWAFDGWYTDETCAENNKWNFDNIVTGNLILYAKWVPHVHTYDGSNPIIQWADDYSSATLSFDCDQKDTGFGCGHTEELKDDNPSKNTTATCIKEGETTYIATFHFDYNNKDYSYKTTIKADAFGHELEKVDGKPATCIENGNIAYYQCKRCGELFLDSAGEMSTSEEEIIIPALGHDPEKVAAKSATCEEKGNKAYWKCSRCNEIFRDSHCEVAIEEDDVTITKKGHDYDTVVQAKAATCTEPGNKAYTYCKNCGDMFLVEEGVYKKVEDSDQIITKALGHDYSKTDVKDSAKKADATCNTPAVYYYSCSRCNSVENNGKHTFENGTGTGHDFTLHEGTAASCTADGTKEYWSCSKCGKNFSNNNPYSTDVIENAPEIIPAKGHHYNTKQETSEYLVQTASCTSPAIYRYKCEDCSAMSGLTYESETYPQLYHHYEVSFEWNMNHTQCTATFVCSKCGEEKHFTVKEGDEEYSKEPLQVEGDIVQCGQQGAVFKAVFTPNLEDVKLSERGKAYTAIDKVKNVTLGHSFTNYQSDDNATCDENGTKTAICDYCGIAKDCVEDLDSAIGHKWSEPVISWNIDGSDCKATFTCEQR